MKFVQGQSREQLVLIPDCLDSLIDSDHEIRVIDLFVDSLPLKDYDFTIKETLEGRPAYHPNDLLKLFIYGYLNGIRSSRKLEAECKRNIEVMWLLKQLTPDHNTISNFRRDNPKAIKMVFRATVKMAVHFELIGARLIAGDSTKLRAQNSKKNNFNQKKIDRHLAYIENKLAEYQQALALADGDSSRKKEIEKEVNKHKARKARYHALQHQLDASDQEQISTSDPDSRQMIIRNNITEVAYNIQSITDAKHCLPIDYKVTNHNDSKAMGNMLRRTKSILRTHQFTALFDKGYHTGSELKTAYDLNIETLVAIPDISSASMAPNPAFNVSEFVYDALTHSYTCPQGNTLVTNGNWYRKDRSSPTRKTNTSVMVQHFKTPACKNCPVLNICTKNTRGRGRVIERTEYQKYYDLNRLNIEQKEHLYKRRQAIIEHNYGTLKRQWGFSYIITKKGLQRASADVGFMFTAYNLRRIINLMGIEKLMADLRQVIRRFSALNCLFKRIFSSLFSLKFNLLAKPQFPLILSPGFASFHFAFFWD